MRLAYSDTQGDPVVVLLHGFPLDRSMWVEQVKSIGSNYRVIAPDLRGHGQSPAPDGVYTMDEMADDVIELLDGLNIRQSVVIGGLSMGGYVALSIVLRHPDRVRGLMLMDTRAGADTPESARGREETASTVIREKSARTVIETMIPRLFGKSTRAKHPQAIGPILASMEQTSVIGVAGALRGMAVRPDRREELGKITVPTLVLVGEDDAITPALEARDMAAAIPNARFEVIPDAGHMAPYENPAAANAAILSFLRQLSDSTPGALNS